jgi:hypothetical protein
MNEKEINMREVEYFSFFGAEIASEYFSQDAGMLEFLGLLDEDEKESLVLDIMVDHDKETAQWSIGNWRGETVHLSMKTSTIDNSRWEEDDYYGVMEFLRSAGVI